MKQNVFLVIIIILFFSVILYLMFLFYSQRQESFEEAQEEITEINNDIEAIKVLFKEMNTREQEDEQMSKLVFCLEDQVVTADHVLQYWKQYWLRVFTLCDKVKTLAVSDPADAEQECRDVRNDICELMNMKTPPPSQLLNAYNSCLLLEYDVAWQRENTSQLEELVREYQQTLNELEQITAIAETLVNKPTTVLDLKQLREEMQKYRTFFMNLSHCRSLLESLESHLDPATRNKFSELHKQLHQQACDILDKAAIRSQQMALAATKWISLDQNLQEETAWLNIVQSRVPHLNAMTCSDYKQYQVLFRALDEDMKIHLVRTTQLVSVCRNITNLIDCPHLEPATGNHRCEILNLERAISSGLLKLSTFTDYWLEYQTLADRLEAWMDNNQNEIEGLNKSDNMKYYWELKAQVEFYNTLLDRARDNFENAMRVFPVSDEVLQRQLYSQLEERWNKLIACMSEQSPSFDSNEDFTQFEYELDQLQTMFVNPRGVIKTEEELCIYIQTLRVISEGVAMLEKKVERCSCSSASVVCDFLRRLKGLKYQVHEETEHALVLEAKIMDLKKTFDDMKSEQNRINVVVEECEATVGEERFAVERSLER